MFYFFFLPPLIYSNMTDKVKVQVVRLINWLVNYATNSTKNLMSLMLYYYFSC